MTAIEELDQLRKELVEMLKRRNECISLDEYIKKYGEDITNQNL